MDMPEKEEALKAFGSCLATGESRCDPEGSPLKNARKAIAEFKHE